MRFPLYLSLCAVCVSAAVSQTTSVLYDGWDIEYAAGSNRTVLASGLERPGSSGPFYRYIDGDGATPGVQHFSLDGGFPDMPSQYVGPALFGGTAWRDNQRPNDTATNSGTVLSIRSNPFDVDNGSGNKADPIRVYIASDVNGITPDEAFGVILFSHTAGANLTGLAWTGATNTDALTATVRWAVVDNGMLYVSNASFPVLNNGSTTQTNALSSVTSTTWATWSPATSVPHLKFSSTSASFSTTSFSNVTKVGFVYELSDTVDGSNYLDTARFTVTTTPPPPSTPVITSQGTAQGNVGQAFTYQIEASGSPTTYGVTGALPGGLSLNASTGFISGTPTMQETKSVTVSATNGQGSGTATLEITIGPPIPSPEIISPGSATAGAGGRFQFQVQATNTPTSYSATGLPAGLKIDATTGLISGTAMIAGQYNVTLTASNAAGAQQAQFTLTVGNHTPQIIPGGKTYRCYFLGNSLTLSLTTAPQPELARLERLFAAHGNGFVFGATLGAGVNLDQHWSGKLYSGSYMKQTVFDDQHEFQLENGWSEPGANFGTTIFRDYNFALQGKERKYDGTIVTGQLWDALVMQPYVGYLEANSFTTAEQANGAIGSRAAINNFVRYANGNNPSNHASVKHFYIYSAWPQLLGIEQSQIDSDNDGVYSFSEFYSSPYNPPVNPANSVNGRTAVPKRDYVMQLHNAVRADNPTLADRIHLIPVGEIMAEFDRLIRTGQLPGIEQYYNRNKQYYINARAGEQIVFNFVYPPGQPQNWGNDFIAAQGIKNIYADNIHWNNQTHNDPDSGTIGAYIAAATVHAVITGENPNRLNPTTVAAYYEALDGEQDVVLIGKIQEVIWQVITSTNWHGINYAERTGVGTPTALVSSFRDFRAAYFSPAQLLDSNVSAGEADPDGDGSSNIEEYFRAGNPMVADVPLALSLTVNSGGASIGFNALRNPVGVNPVLEVSGDLHTWSRLDECDLQQISQSNGMATYSSIIPGTAHREFYRVALPYVPDQGTLPFVAWGASKGIVNSHQNFSGGLGSLAVNLTTPANPAVGTNYSTYSPVFFAAFAATSGNSAEILRINDNGTPDETGDVMLLKLTQGTASRNDGTFTAIWKQNGDGSQGKFLNGADTGNVHLANMQIAAKIGAGSGSVSEMRFVIQRGGKFYISQSRGAISSVNKTTGAGNDAPFEVVALPNPHGVEWFEYDPSTDSYAIGQPVSFTSFDGITAVGFNWRTNGVENLRYLYVESFQANFFPAQ